MKKPIRKLHIKGEEWHYLMFCGGAKVFPPNSKSCMAEVFYDDCPHDAPDQGSTNSDGTKDFTYTHDGWRPGRLKEFVEKELLPRRYAWVAAGKPVLTLRGSPSDERVEEWRKVLEKEDD